MVFDFHRHQKDGRRKFSVYKRERNGFTHKVGTILADNKVQADTRVRYLYAKFQQSGEGFWAVEDTEEEQAA